MVAVGFEPTPSRTSALNWRLGPLGQTTCRNTKENNSTYFLKLCEVFDYLHFLIKYIENLFKFSQVLKVLEFVFLMGVGTTPKIATSYKLLKTHNYLSLIPTNIFFLYVLKNSLSLFSIFSKIYVINI